MRTRLSKGRRHPEEPHPFRPLYTRDRDRIVHSTAFRRLMYKTQVLVTHTNDYHRTRLTHTLEVAQIGRTIARQLGLNEDLTEAVALAHDLGHPPLGHAGEAAVADSLAYDTHDVDDALNVGLITAADLAEVPFWQQAVERVLRHGRPGPEQFQPTVVRALIDWQVNDLLEHTWQRLRQGRVRSV